MTNTVVGLALRAAPHWKWHLDEVVLKTSGVTHYLWRAVDHEGEVLESYVSKGPLSQGGIEIPEEINEAPWSSRRRGNR